jgi:hypothetical protein
VREKSYGSTLSLPSMLEGDGWSTPWPGRFAPGIDPVTSVLKVGWASGPVRKISPPSGFGPRTVHPVTRSYTGPPLIDNKTINLCISTVNTESCSVSLVRSSICVPHHDIYACRSFVTLHMTSARLYIRHTSALIYSICHFWLDCMPCDMHYDPPQT